MIHHLVEYVSIAGAWYGTWAHHAAHGHFRGQSGTLGTLLPILRWWRP